MMRNLFISLNHDVINSSLHISSTYSYSVVNVFVQVSFILGHKCICHVIISFSLDIFTFKFSDLLPGLSRALLNNKDQKTTFFVFSIHRSAERGSKFDKTSIILRRSLREIKSKLALVFEQQRAAKSSIQIHIFKKKKNNSIISRPTSNIKVTLWHPYKLAIVNAQHWIN